MDVPRLSSSTQNANANARVGRRVQPQRAFPTATMTSVVAGFDLDCDALRPPNFWRVRDGAAGVHVPGWLRSAHASYLDLKAKKHFPVISEEWRLFPLPSPISSLELLQSQSLLILRRIKHRDAHILLALIGCPQLRRKATTASICNPLLGRRIRQDRPRSSHVESRIRRTLPLDILSSLYFRKRSNL